MKHEMTGIKKHVTLTYCIDHYPGETNDMVRQGPKKLVSPEC